MKTLRLLPLFCLLSGALAQQIQIPWGRPDIRVSPADRVYVADQTSNTVSVIKPYDNKLLGVIRLGTPCPAL
jgi:YVTN family beta-propeller protein